MSRIRNLLQETRFGLGATLLIVAGTALYVAAFGPLYGVWGWPEMVLTCLLLAACSMAGVEMLFRPPNPYGRTYALYDLRDLPPDRNLNSGGTGWMIQAAPMILAAVVLAGIFLVI